MKLNPKKPTDRIALTPGEPAGIGPDLVIQLAQKNLPCELVVFADPDVLAQRAHTLGLPLTLEPMDFDQKPKKHRLKHLKIVPIHTFEAVECGVLNPGNALYVLECLTDATHAVLKGTCDALVTGPVHKGVINQAGIHFTGHTEFLAALCEVPMGVMMLTTQGLRVALVTQHIALKEVYKHINANTLTTIVRILQSDLQKRFGIDKPVIAVCGVNPHAGEGGHLGREEIDILEPALAKLRAEGLDIVGPIPADTAFTPERLKRYDVILTMYHDQGLPVLKHMGFGQAVNITLGLPIIRTSVDHGTALDLTGTGKADTGSLHAAILQAIAMTKYDAPTQS